MGQVQVRSYVNLPEIARGQIGTLPENARLRGLLAAGLVEIVGRRPARPALDLPQAPSLPEERELPPVAAPDTDLPVPDGTVREVLDWVGDDVGRATAALDRELGSTVARSTLVARLLALTEPTGE